VNGSIRVGHLFGIPFSIHPSWFLVVGLMTWSYGNYVNSQFPTLAAGLPWLWGLLAALLLFSSVLAHELGHSLVSIAQGVPVKSIDLFLFGGLASLERESKTPGDAFRVAIAGPLVSFVLYGLLTALQALWQPVGPIGAMVQLLASINLILGIFNLIPGLPLDGGNVLKALVWKVTGDAYKGISVASWTGQAVGWLGIALGLLPLLLGGSPQIWTAAVGWFLLQNARRYGQTARIQGTLNRLTAADAIAPDRPLVPLELSLREFVNDYVIGQPERDRYYAINTAGQLAGSFTYTDVKHIHTTDWPLTAVAQVVQAAEMPVTVRPEQSLLEVITLLEQRQLPVLAVVQGNGTLVGLLEKDTIRQFLQHRLQGQAWQSRPPLRQA
jgi:Zn-dependent protease